MKVVLFCGGLGMRMRADNQSLPKPMMPIGSRPVLWHVMRYYAHFGHTEFILCLGHGAQAVKDYFLDYRETTSNDFVLDQGRRATSRCSSTDISDWTHHVHRHRHRHGDRRTPAPRAALPRGRRDLPGQLRRRADRRADERSDRRVHRDAMPWRSLLAVKPQDSFHVVDIEADSTSPGLTPVADMAMRINGGYFILRQGIFDYLNEGEDLVMDACIRAAKAGRMRAVRYDGFWAPMDTLKERTALEEQYRRGNSPWALWRERPVDLGAR